jgi:hypothetical protein
MPRLHVIVHACARTHACMPSWRHDPGLWMWETEVFGEMAESVNEPEM